MPQAEFEHMLFTKYCTFWCHLLLFGIIEIFHLKIQRKICELFPKMTIFRRAEYYYGKIYIHNHILIKFFVECITDIQKKKFQKEAMSTCFTESWQATECIFTLFLMNFVVVRVRRLYVKSRRWSFPEGHWCPLDISLGSLPINFEHYGRTITVWKTEIFFLYFNIILL